MEKARCADCGRVVEGKPAPKKLILCTGCFSLIRIWAVSSPTSVRIIERAREVGFPVGESGNFGGGRTW